MGDGFENPYSGVDAAEGIYRAAFPAFRVFIYGMEVSGDVIDARVNQSGGSQDRSPSTCSITLANYNDKYIVNHTDMLILGTSRQNLDRRFDENIQAYRDWVEMITEIDPGGSDFDSFMSRLSQLDAEGAGAFQDLGDLISVYSNLKSSGGFFEGYYNGDLQVPDGIKYTVLQNKAPQVLYDSEGAINDLMKDEILWPYIKSKQIYLYPFQEGDCIFHPNDPIRIVFRDPFSPNVWYWMFTGFVDSFTENRGVNRESTVTITGTDVTKSVRYAFLQTNTDQLDPAIRKIFRNNPAFQGPFGDSPVGELKANFYNEIFSGFSPYEILEILFFGLDDFRPILDDTVMATIRAMDDSEINTYLLNTLGRSKEEVASMQPAERRKQLQKRLVDEKQDRFPGSSIPLITTPRGIPFKRKTVEQGVRALFIGDELNPVDEALGEKIPIANIRELNDLLHHRVRVEDLDTMLKYDAIPSLEKGWTLEDVITQIGTDIERYPVGHGNVYYVAPANLGPKVSRGILDQSTAGTALQHSEFKDRLSFIYDLADAIDFRFYATPRGDVVFEMPFYDFSVDIMDSKDPSVYNDRIRKELEDLTTKYFDFWVSDSDKYTEGDFREMMDLPTKLEVAQQGFDVFYQDLLDEYSYTRAFTIEHHETTGYSNSLNDSGLKTVGRAMPNLLINFAKINDEGLRRNVYVTVPELAQLLGFRIASYQPWCPVATKEGAQVFASLMLRKSNAEARNLGIGTVPMFGLMVNRPIYWRERNYMANLVSAQHSIVWNSSCDTTVNLNNVRGWTGSTIQEHEIYEFFGGKYPFDYNDVLRNRR